MKYFSRLGVASVLSFSLALVTLASTAQADVGFGVQGGFTRHRVKHGGAPFTGYSSRPITSPAFRVYFHTDYFSAGLIKLGIETGGMVQDRKYTVTGGGQTEEFSYNEFLVDTSLRVSIPFLSVGIGPYLGSGLGMVDRTTGTNKRNVSMGSAGISILDLGLISSARLRFPILPIIGITADIRYLLGTHDTANRSDAKTYTRELQWLFGVDFRL